MTDRRPFTLVEAEPRPVTIKNHAHAAKTLGDTPYLAYVLVQSFKLFIALVGRRWPELR